MIIKIFSFDKEYAKEFIINKSRILIIFLLFFGLVLLFTNNLYAQTTYKEYDTNGDGKIDRWIWLYNGFEQRVMMDLNFDGTPDAEYRYIITNDGSIPQFQQFDTNFDGKYDDFYYFENGKLVRQEIDSNFDGKIDIIIYIQDNYIYKIEQDKDFDGKFETVINY
ncbi:MAG: hypothetical protein WH035_06045 [Spirochaetota bacterium]